MFRRAIFRRDMFRRAIFQRTIWQCDMIQCDFLITTSGMTEWNVPNFRLLDNAWQFNLANQLDNSTRKFNR